MYKLSDTLLNQPSLGTLRAAPARERRGTPGVIIERGFCYRIDRVGRHHFNFRQQVWLAPRVPMAFTPVHSAALRTLAVNVLTAVSGERSLTAARGSTSARVLTLARPFCEEILLTAPAQAWTLPYSSVADWLLAHQRIRITDDLHAPCRPPVY